MYRLTAYLSIGLYLSVFSLQAAEIQMPVDIEVVGQRIEVTGYLDDEREQYWALDGNELIPILAQSITAGRLEQLRPVLKDNKVSAADFEQIGWKSVYDTDNLIIQLNVPVTDRRLVNIALEPSQNGPAPSNLPQSQPALFSGVLNTYWSHTHNLVDTEYAASQVALRARAAFGPVTFEDGHTYSYNHFNDQGSWLRDRTRLIGNLPNNWGYLQLGDYQIDTDIASLPGGDLFGLSYSYQPSYIKNYERPNIVPISLESTSLVNIRINGEDYRTIRLASGQYNLRDLPLEQGVNEVELNYIDQSGSEQKLFFNLVDHPQLLLEGDIETQLVYGAQQNYEDDGDKTIDRDQFVTQGVISYGLTDWWTISPTIDISQTTKRYSLDQSFAVGEFFITLNGDWSEVDTKRSYKLDSQFYASELFNKRLSNLSFRYGVERRIKDDPLVHTLRLSSGINTPFDIGYLSFNLEHQFDPNGTLRQSASINTSYRINQRITTSLNLRWQKQRNTIDRTLYFTLSFPLRWHDISVSTRTAYDSDENEYRSQISASQYDSKYYWRASTNFIDKKYDGFDGYGKIYGERAVWNGRYSSRNVSQESSNRALTLGVDTGIAWAGNQFVWTAPLSSSFNIVALPDEYRDKYALMYDEYKRLQIVSSELGGHSSLAIPIQNERHQVIKISGDNLDFNEELKHGEYVANGGLYSGSFHQLNINKGFFVNGFFHDRNDKPLADVVGEFRHLNNKTTYPFFTDQLGNFELDVLPTGEYEVYFYDNAAPPFKMSLDDSNVIDDMFIELGIVTVL